MANVTALWEAITGEKVCGGECPDWVHKRYESLTETGLVGYAPKASSPGGFVHAIRQIQEWHSWEQQHCLSGLTVSDLRAYTGYYFAHEWVVREQHLMDVVLGMLMDTSTTPPRFRLTSTELEEVIEADKTQPSGTSAEKFHERLRLAIHEKTGRFPDDRGTVQHRLKAAEVEAGAPTYIRNSALSTYEKHALWKASGWNHIAARKDPGISLDAAKRHLAASGHIERRHQESLEDAIRRQLHNYFREARLTRRLETATKETMAREIAERMPLYSTEHDRPAIDTLAEKFMTLTKEELICLHYYSDGLEEQREIVAMLRGLSGMSRG